ncbi:CbrC family protein [Streptomyces sp. BPTC-684]|uniref:CbrC family protein n=1 Tax=Streptomyces sp. BPTC-684 TaxID=3043734 RepID=UPI0032C22BAB
MTEQFPEFPYQPDPVTTGVIVPSGTTCVCCGRVRGCIDRDQGPSTPPRTSRADCARGA